MSSSRKTPVQDITNKKNQGNSQQRQYSVPSLLSEILKCDDVYADPKEGQRQRDRERYANNRDEICKCQRQLRELNKQSTAAVNDETQAIGQSGVTQIQYRATEEGNVLYNCICRCAIL
jgi:hypothetical protein